MPEPLTISANLVDVLGRRIFPATVRVEQGRIASIVEESRPRSSYLLPGLIDAHVHIESSMLVPAEFARASVVHGTVATVSDPHEIANVLGIDGVHYMLENAQAVPFKFYFGAPSCVPATTFETAGAELGSAEVARLLDDDRILYLSEMMNVPGVLAGDATVMAKIGAARALGKPVDGHAPALRGSAAAAYFGAGITTDHECCSYEEAAEKIRYGAKISIREGSAARNFDALYPLLDEYPDDCFLCSDDKHPDELLVGHIDTLVRRALRQGIDRMNVLRAACVNPVLHYGLDVGLLREGDSADFIQVDDLDSLRAPRTFVAGVLVAENGRTMIERVEPRVVNQFVGRPRPVGAFHVPAAAAAMHVIDVVDGQLITGRLTMRPKVVDGLAVSDPDRDLLKIAVVNRYGDTAPALAFIKNFGLRRGAMASSVAHDSHNVVAVGVADEDLAAAVNLVLEARGGLAVAAGPEHELLPLPVAGLMASGSYEDVAQAYARLDARVKQLGSRLRAPFMTLSFMALLVIPELKLSDRGLFDGKRFDFLPLFANGPGAAAQ